MPMEFPVDPSSLPEDDLVELVWDKGQISMQSQSSRVRNSQNYKPPDKYVGKTVASRIGRFDSFESFLDDAPPAVPEGDLSLVDDIVPWFDDFLSETSDVTMSELPIHNIVTPLNKRSSVQPFGSLGDVSVFNRQKLEHPNGVDTHSSRTGPMSSWSFPQGQTPVPSFGSRVSDILSSCTASSTVDAIQPSPSGSLASRMQRKDLTRPGSSSSLPNLPFLSRHTALVRASLHNNTGLPSTCSSTMETTENKEKNSATTGSNLIESVLLPTGNLQKQNHFQNQFSLGFSKVHPTPEGSQPPKLLYSAKLSNQSHQEDQGEIVSSDHPVVSANPNSLVLDGEKTVEPVIASSSVCSRRSADKTSNCQMQNLKRKDHDREETQYQSEDVEEESVGVRKSAPTREGASLKRNRDTEVHNLSERRRRERINEKMRALQELMPNCNKFDKASMLDEAIEYLKTLQLELQMMSMGDGVYMPQMMIPAAMQHMHAAHVSHFAPMGMGTGIGMGMGYGVAGMQMLNMNGGSPMFPSPSIQRPQFASPSVSLPSNFPQLGCPNLPNLEYPGQGRSISVPRAPFSPLTHVSTNSSVCVNATRMGSQVEAPSTFPTLNSMDRVQSNDHQRLQDSSMDLVTTQSLGIKSINSNPPPLQQNNSQEVVHGIGDGLMVLPNPEGVEMIT